MVRKCPICNGTEHKKIKKIKLAIPKEYHLPEEYNVVVCDTCGFCFSDTSATIEDYDYYYSNCNSYSGTPVGEDAWSELNCQVEKLIAPHLNDDSFCLDMGFGKGNFLRWLKKKGYHNVYGVDPSIESVEKMKVDGIKTYRGSVFQEPPEELCNMFDCVFLFDVLEHLLYPGEALEIIKAYLKKEGGYLVISVPNYAHLDKDTSLLTNQFNQEHINYFSITALDNLLNLHHFFRIDEKEERACQDQVELIVIYRLEKNEGTLTEMKKDEVCQKSIQKFVDRNSRLEEKINLELRTLEENEVYVWGTGAYTMWLLANTVVGKKDISAFVDNNPTKVGKELWNKKIIKPEQIEDEKPILVCSMLYSNKIVEQIKNMGLVNKVIVV